jgi:hypothetical protein
MRIASPAPAVLPLAQGLFALTHGEPSKDDRVKAERYITRMNPATGAVPQGLARRAEIASIGPCGNGPQLGVRPGGKADSGDCECADEPGASDWARKKGMPKQRAACCGFACHWAHWKKIGRLASAGCCG